VHELLRIGDTPAQVQICERSATFHYADGRWLRTALYPTAWPATLTQLLDHATAQALPAGFFEALAQLAPFGDEVHVLPACLSTSISRDVGARVDVPTLNPGPTDPRFTLRQLLALEGVATAINFADYPNPCRFVGTRTRGVILGRA
jgi:hypothetical protein